MKKTFVFLVALALLAPVIGSAQAEVYVEGYIGGNFSANTSSTLVPVVVPPGNWFNPGFRPSQIDPAFLGGIKIGTWFVKEGFLGFHYPDWMKYLGFYIDVSYHRLDFTKEAVTGTAFSQIYTGPFPYFFQSEGEAVTVAFMFALRYGFFPDRDVPFGRFQPYVAVGPALMITWQRPTFTANNVVIPAKLSDGNGQLKTARDANVALAVEAGVRWMVLQKVSLDVSFKYRRSQASYFYSIFGKFYSSLHCTDWFPTYNLFAIQVGAAYHF